MTTDPQHRANMASLITRQQAAIATLQADSPAGRLAWIDAQLAQPRTAAEYQRLTMLRDALNRYTAMAADFDTWWAKRKGESE